MQGVSVCPLYETYVLYLENFWTGSTGVTVKVTYSSL